MSAPAPETRTINAATTLLLSRSLTVKPYGKTYPMPHVRPMRHKGKLNRRYRKFLKMLMRSDPEIFSIVNK